MREKGLIIDGKMLSDFTQKGKEVWKKIPAVTHPFQVGDRVVYTDDTGCEKLGVVTVTDGILKKYPYDTNSTLDRKIVVRLDLGWDVMFWQSGGWPNLRLM
jgi:hypothetical protein